MMHFRKAKTKRSKAQNQQSHTKLRARQRFGVWITNADLDRMAEVYRYSLDTKVLTKQSNRRVKAIITYKGEAFPIIYDKVRHQLATILSPEYLNTNERTIYTEYKNKLIKGELK